MPKRPGSKSSAAEIRSGLRAAGIRSTAARVAVLEVLHRLETPVSHAELAAHAELAGFDRATVYRNLVDLADAGLLSRTDLGDHVWRFELKDEPHTDSGEHPHFVCNDCGSVACLDDVTIEIKPKAARLKHAVTEILLKGTCDRCG
jgi:Fur family ferric uptake transcriptional regulator